MLPEEKAFRKWYRVAYPDEVPAIRRDFKRLCADLIRAVREDDARVAESPNGVCDGTCVCAKEIAAAIRARK